MTKLLRELLREDYLGVLKARMMEQHHNQSSLARDTGFSPAHIGNVFRDKGSDDAIAAICRVLEMDIRKDLFKKDIADAEDATGTEG